MSIYKYLEKQYLESFKEKGMVHLYTLDELRFLEKKDIGDRSEGVNILRIGKLNTVRFSGKDMEKYHLPIVISDKSEANFTNCTFTNYENGYVFCTTIRRNDNYWAERKYDAYFIINDSSRFCRILFEKLYDSFGVEGFLEGVVTYDNNREKVIEEANKAHYLKNDTAHPYACCFQKDPYFTEQLEYRMFFICRNAKPQPPIACPELREFCIYE
jgi:hypothetical protein